MTLFLFFTSLVAGALNAVAGGGSFLTLPALIYAGVPPVAANATSTVALWPGSMSSAWAYRRELADSGRWLVVLAAVSVFGGLLGAVLLVRTSNTSFLRLLPWLMFTAAATFTFGGRLAAQLGPRGQLLLRSAHGHPTIWALVLQLVIAIYGGYFGGGMGIMMLAVFAITGMTNMHAMNGLKAVLAFAINGVALVEFSRNGSVAWAPAVVMIAGGIVGGYAGAALARQLRGEQIRWVVVATAWTMTIYFFARGA
jgi:uncharacterized membrane protein YfcA